MWFRFLSPGNFSRGSFAFPQGHFISGAVKTGYFVAGVLFLLLIYIALLMLFSPSNTPSKTRSSVNVNNSSLQNPINNPNNPNLNSISNDSTTSSNSDQSNNVTTVLNSSNVNGVQNTSLSVNGTPVSIPANGSKQTTVNGVNVSISHSESSSGTASNSSSSTTSLDVISTKGGN